MSLLLVFNPGPQVFEQLLQDVHALRAQLTGAGNSYNEWVKHRKNCEAALTPDIPSIPGL